MIHFDAVAEPSTFDREVRQPGLLWLESHTSGRPKDYWSSYKGDLARGFGHLCAYSAMFEPVGTVDHFVSCDEDRAQAYSWSNYRYASAWLNSSKSNLASSTILDPLEVQDGWFKILLPSLQLVVDEDRIPQEFLGRAQFVLERLHLRHDERVLRQRQEWYRMYTDGELTLEGLARKAPLIARAIEAQIEASSP